MEVREHIEALRQEGQLLAAAVAAADLDTPIPTTPEWRMRDLVRHIGDVHRWARAHVEGRTTPIGRDELPKIAGPLPPDPELLEWFREGHRHLVEALEAAEPDRQAWTFLPAPSPIAFWARRQAHETGVHRADAQSPTGRITPFEPAVAVDGIEELLFGFLGRPGGEAIDPPRSLSLQATDTQGEWLVRLEDGIQVSREGGRADCSVRATASDLHLLLWNRRTADGLDVEGDRSVLAFWRGAVQITWSRPR
jgi:uncharacterized protein (TIGR03083 family)